MPVAELKEKHAAATETVNNLKDRLRQKRQQLLDTDVAGYARSQGKSPIAFGPTDLVCCRTLQGHTGKKTHAIKLPCAWVMTCAFCPTGQSVACGGLDSICSIFNLNSSTDKDGNLPVSISLSGHKGYVSCCQYVPDEDIHIITSSTDQTCVLWDITTGFRTSVFGGEFQSGHTDGNKFGIGSDDGTCRLFDIRTGHLLQVYYQQLDDNEVPHVNRLHSPYLEDSSLLDTQMEIAMYGTLYWHRIRTRAGLAVWVCRPMVVPYVQEVGIQTSRSGHLEDTGR
ncbi:Guanine nucleotide-binding protein subunit beta [Hibiscus syriacus]|uniref:Guanine nucleotide-binding protein subunit beta n=1 Tax=Hibiscus syriacus TaxID=106335 RepID=A0A6A3C5P2_HIBSY|nr:Guanine nucleotide-binding protein subunit beta [Hibiscus syriacus]